MKDLFNYLSPGEQKRTLEIVEANRQRRIATFDVRHPNGEFCPVRFECPHGMQVCEHFMCGACQLVTEYQYGSNPNPKHTFRIRVFGHTLFELTWRGKRGNREIRRLARGLDYDVRYTLREREVQRGWVDGGEGVPELERLEMQARALITNDESTYTLPDHIHDVAGCAHGM